MKKLLLMNIFLDFLISIMTLLAVNSVIYYTWIQKFEFIWFTLANFLITLIWIIIGIGFIVDDFIYEKRAPVWQRILTTLIVIWLLMLSENFMNNKSYIYFVVIIILFTTTLSSLLRYIAKIICRKA